MSSTGSKRISSSRLRQITEFDISAICWKADEQRKKADKTTSRLVDIPTVVHQLRTKAVDHYVLDEQILLVYTVGTPWYSTSLVLEELLVLRLYDGKCRIKDVCDLLDDIADEHEVACTYVGSAASERPEVLRRAYMRYGFKVEDSGLVKWR